MAIYNDDGPTEVSTVMGSAGAESSQFCILETNKITKKGYKMSSSSKINDVSEVILKQKVKKLKKKAKETNQTSTSLSSTDCEDNSSNITEICEKDLFELRRVYKQCKSVMRKMEQKYGNLLDTSSTETSDGPNKKRLRLIETSQAYESECRCILNKKIVFNEDGQEVMIETPPSNHICPSKLMLKNLMCMEKQNENIEIEYSENTTLSDNLLELRRILQDPSIEITYRNRVIEKLKLIKQIHLDDIRFNKVSLIEELKSNPDEVFNFNGSNLSVIRGYFV